MKSLYNAQRYGSVVRGICERDQGGKCAHFTDFVSLCRTYEQLNVLEKSNNSWKKRVLCVSYFTNKFS